MTLLIVFTTNYYQNQQARIGQSGSRRMVLMQAKRLMVRNTETIF